MIITACTPPPPPVTAAVEVVEQCRSFHSIEALLQWAKEHGIDTSCAEWRWP